MVEKHCHRSVILSSAVKKLIFVQPPSAAAARVFSLVATMFGSQQRKTLEDYIEAALRAIA